VSGATPGRGFEVQPVTDTTTTISIDEWQKEWLDDFKEPGQSYKGALESLIEIYGQYEAQSMESHNGGIDTDEIQEQLDRIESSAQTAEERTGAIERQLEGLQQ
jgi:hypothetical protein